MAEEGDDSEKTEDPSQKKLDDALKRGDVVKSQEINTWFVLGGATLALLAGANSMGAGLEKIFRGLIANSYQIPLGGPEALALTEKIGFAVVGAVALPLGILMLAALGGNLIQHRLVWSTEALKPKLSKISPLAGAKRLFSKQALINLAKGLLKLALIGTVMVWLLWPERFRLEGLVATDPQVMLPFTRSLALQMLGAVVAVLALIAAADYFIQYRQWWERQKMSVRELKEEFKQQEGDPAIKGKIRQLRQQRMRKRMMAAVPQASVVITNPTHYAVALKYDPVQSGAPVVVAKGADFLAQKIREVATEHDVIVLESPPLARAVYYSTELEQPIPAGLYLAVAQVLAYVYQIRQFQQGKGQRPGPMPEPPIPEDLRRDE